MSIHIGFKGLIKPILIVNLEAHFENEVFCAFVYYLKKFKIIAFYSFPRKKKKYQHTT